MARIFIKSQRDPLIISNDRAKVLKQNHELFRNKKIEDVWLEIDSWCGNISRITEIHLEEDRKYSGVPEFKPLTPAEEEASRIAMKRVRENLFGKNKK